MIFNQRWMNNRLVIGTRGDTSTKGDEKKGDYGEMLRNKKPFAAGKIGTAELLALEYFDRYIRLPWPSFWSWQRPAQRLLNNAGFFPLDRKAFYQWNITFRNAIRQINYICAWQQDSFLAAYEQALIKKVAPTSCPIEYKKIVGEALPAISSVRWLVVSPFVKTMKQQLPRLAAIHRMPTINEALWQKIEETCQFVRCPFQSHLEPSPFRDWQEGLESLSKEILAKDFDLALIGAGAWSLPLASKIKQAGKSAIHMGGDIQLLFGIKGGRWDHLGLYNECWIQPEADERPQHRNRIEDGCYW